MTDNSIELNAQSQAKQTSSLFVRCSDRISALSAIIAGVALIVILASMLGEILLRAVWGISFKQNWEVSSYALGAVFFLPAGYALKHGAHIRTSAIEMLGGPGAVKAMDRVCFVVAAVTLGYCAYAMAMRANESFWSGAVSWADTGIPVWAPESIIAFGLLVFAVQCLAELLRSAVLGQETAADEQAQLGTSV